MKVGYKNISTSFLLFAEAIDFLLAIANVAREIHCGTSFSLNDPKYLLPIIHGMLSRKCESLHIFARKLTMRDVEKLIQVRRYL